MSRLPPDAFAALAIGLALLLEWLLPLHVLPLAHPFSVSTWLGMGIAVAGLVIEALAARELVKARTSTRAGDAASALVTSGPFSRSRNPFYVGLLLVLAGVAIAFSLDWGLVTVPLAWVALDRIVVPREEAMLRERFPAFSDYSRRVRRWL